MIRFIHAADIHLDSLMKGIRSDRAGIDPKVFRESTRSALTNLVNWAIAERVDFVTLGGDIYDGDWRSFETGLFFVREMTRLRDAGIPIVSIRGNHDAKNKMTRDLPLPDNFTMLGTDEPESFEIVPGVIVTGQSFGKEAETGNLVAAYPANDSRDAIRIGLLHTSLAGGSRDGHDNYAPCDLGDLFRKRYHFWGLGHIHQAGWMNRPGDTPVLYPGNLQGRHPKETGEKGAWAITLADDGSLTDRQFRTLDATRWETTTIDISDLASTDDCWDAVETGLKSIAAAARDRPIAVRLGFAGRSAIHHQLLRLSEKDEATLISNCQNAANLACRDRIWIESVDLRSTAPRIAHGSTEAMRTLAGFAVTTAATDTWIDEFLESPEIVKLRNSIDLFESTAERAHLESHFEREELKKILSEVPDILEALLIEVDERKGGD